MIDRDRFSRTEQDNPNGEPRFACVYLVNTEQ